MATGATAAGGIPAVSTPRRSHRKRTGSSPSRRAGSGALPRRAAQVSSPLPAGIARRSGSTGDPRAQACSACGLPIHCHEAATRLDDDVPRAEVVVLEDAREVGQSIDEVGRSTPVDPVRQHLGPQPLPLFCQRRGGPDVSAATSTIHPAISSTARRARSWSRAMRLESCSPFAALSSDAGSPAASNRPMSTGACAAVAPAAAAATSSPRSSLSNDSRAAGLGRAS